MGDEPRLHPADHSALPDTAIESPRSERLVRVLNVVIAIVALVALSPMLVVIALAIKASSPGPVIYKQSRVGLNRRRERQGPAGDRRTLDVGGRVFTIYKFRTMTVDAEAQSGEVWAVPMDPRVTGVGRFIRRFRLDELPQLWNVIKGDMNIVGPRPERPTIALRLRAAIPAYAERHRVKPGITGLAQIKQSYDATVEDVESKVRWDIEYIRRRSVAFDLVIMLLTVPSVVLKNRGW